MSVYMQDNGHKGVDIFVTRVERQASDAASEADHHIADALLNVYHISFCARQKEYRALD